MVKRYDAMAALGAAGIVDIQKLSKWIGRSDQRYEDFVGKHATVLTAEHCTCGNRSVICLC